jgi:hypothetical protein
LLKGRDYLIDLDADERIILNWILENESGVCGPALSRSLQGATADCFEHINKPSRSAVDGEFLDSVTINFSRRTLLQAAIYFLHLPSVSSGLHTAGYGLNQ